MNHKTQEPDIPQTSFSVNNDNLATSSDEVVEVSMWVDPICPFAWLTSRWLLEVEQVRPIKINFHIMSLSILNKDKKVPKQYRKLFEDGWGPVRVGIAAEQAYGSEVLRDLYTALGKRIHLQKHAINTDLYLDALAEVSLPSTLAKAAQSSEFDEVLYSSHHAGMDPVGEDVGTPVIHVPGPDGQQIAFFGPVLSPAPKGQVAGRLWDGVVLVAGTPGFFELKRTRSADLIFD